MKSFREDMALTTYYNYIIPSDAWPAFIACNRFRKQILSGR